MATPLRKNPISRKRGPDVSSEIRRAFMRAIKELQNQKDKNPRNCVDFADLIRESLQKNLPGTLKALAPYVPRDVFVGGDEDNPIRIEVVKYGDALTHATKNAIDGVVIKEALVNEAYEKEPEELGAPGGD